MQRTLGRMAVLLAVLALLVGACGPAATSSAPSAAPSAASAAPGESAEASGSAEPVPTPLPVTGSQADPGDVVIRWYCCLGTGDAPEQVEVELKVTEDFNASHEGIHLQFEGFIYQGARDALSTQLASGNGPDIVGPVGIGGAEAFHGQWLDLQPLIDKTSFDMSQFPQSTVDLYNAGGEGQLGIPYAVYPSVLFYKADMFKEAGLAEPPHTWNSDYTMPDGSKKPWDYDTVQRDRQDPDRRRERQGRDRRGLRSREDRRSGASSRSATTCARPGPTSVPARSWRPTARPRRSRSPGPPRGSSSTTGSGPTTTA